MASSDNSDALARRGAETRLVTAGRDTKAQKGFVNPPVFHGSTVLHPTAEDLHAHRGVQGVDISLQAATKYIGGHSGIMFGSAERGVSGSGYLKPAFRS